MGTDIAFFINQENPEGRKVGVQLMKTARERGFSCYELHPDVPPTYSEAPLFLAAVGGDGTILKSVPYAVGLNTAILGINTGRVGFLSEIPPQDFSRALTLYEENSLLVEERMMLACTVNGRHAGTCLNDMLLYKKAFSGVALISFEVNGEDAGTVFCDGIIAGTPTGATGYSISAGGPIIAPGLDACVITPICSHSLLARPIVTPPDATLSFKMHSAGCLYADGVKLTEVNGNDEITVTRADCRARFLRIGRHNLYRLIKEKLT